MPTTFGIFDHIEGIPGTSTERLLRDRLELVRLADEAGLSAYHLAEHHGSDLCLAPNQELFVCAAAQVTERIRLGPMVKLLPLHHPVRILEDMCVADQLTGGRLDFGVGRGVAPIEHAWFGSSWAESRERFADSLGIICRALATGEIASDDSPFWDFPTVPLATKPLQDSIPFWYPGNPVIAGRYGMSLMSAGPIDRRTYDLYVDAWNEHEGDAVRLDGPDARPRVGCTMLVAIGPEDRALETARRAMDGLVRRTTSVHDHDRLVLSEEECEAAQAPLRSILAHIEDAISLGAGTADQIAERWAAFLEPGSDRPRGAATPGRRHDLRRSEAHARALRRGREAAARASVAFGLAGVGGPRHLEGELVTARRGLFWVGDETTSLPQGSVLRGQMFVQWEAPATVTKPYPIVLVHGGGGQGTDWLGTPDGRPGWATFLLREGYAVYVVDRPGHGRSPFHPDVLGPMRSPLPLELVSRLFTKAAGAPGAHPTADLHTQWPGSGDPGDPCVRQFAAGTGPMLADLSAAHAVERERGAALLDEIGPAILMTTSAGGPMGWLTADARPSLVRAIVSLEPLGPPFRADSDFSLDWGLTAAPMTFDPPATSPDELERLAGPLTVQAKPARTLPALAGIPIAIVEAEASSFALSCAATAAFLEQAGCRVDRIVLAEHGVHGNGHLMMLERNSRDVLEPILRWLDDTVNGAA